MNQIPLVTAAAFAVALYSSAGAAVIGIESFNTNGGIAGQTGGTGWDYDKINNVQTGFVSDWDNVGASPSVSGQVLVTQESSAKREFNGTVEGSGGGDGANTERAGAVRGVGTVFFTVFIARSAGSTWSGVSSYDFGAERIFFGVRSADAGTDTVGIDESGVGSATGAITLTDGQTYMLVGVVDFDNDRLGLFVNPDGSDSWSPTGGTADVTRTYTGTNWSTAARLGSGGTGPTTWDDLKVSTTFAEAIPEPSSFLLSSLATLGLLVRRRR